MGIIGYIARKDTFNLATFSNIDKNQLATVKKEYKRAEVGEISDTLGGGVSDSFNFSIELDKGDVGFLEYLHYQINGNGAGLYQINLINENGNILLASGETTTSSFIDNAVSFAQPIKITHQSVLDVNVIFGTLNTNLSYSKIKR